MSNLMPSPQPPPTPPRGAGLELAGQVAAAALIGRVAHDLNNHLTTILGKAELALLSGDAERMKSALDLGADAARRARDLVAHLQRFAATQRTSQWAVVNLADAVRPTLAILARPLEKGGIALERRFGEVAPVTADLGALSLAVYHLVRNAVEALGSKGGRLQISLEPKGEDAEIRVTDDGPGLPDDLIARSADPSFPSRDPESGGLRLAAYAARAHGGRLVLANLPEGGAALALRLHRRPPGATPVSP